MSKQDLKGVWTVLSTSPPKLGIAVTPTGHEVTAGSLLAGVDGQGRRLLLIPLQPGEAAKTDTRGRAVHLARLAHEGTHYLTVSCLLPELHGVFTQFCRELVETVEGAASPAREAASAFDRWRTLFSDAERRSPLGEEELTGLIGELLAVERLLLSGAPSDLRFWVGPFGDLHDLRSPAHAIEVKATVVREGRIVSISSVDQLQEPPGADLLLLHTRLDRDPGGFNLPDVVTRVLAARAQREELDRRLTELGASLVDLKAYAGRRFRVTDSRAYDVKGTSFPRLIRSSFTTGDVPAGVLRLGYAIDLTNEPPHPLDDQTVDVAFSSLAEDMWR